MLVRIGTFNLNNLFSRFNFQGAIDEIQNTSGGVGSLTIRYEFTDPDNIRIRTFLGRLVRGKNPVDIERIVERIARLDLDILAVQEVENIEILREFNRSQLGGLYSTEVLLEGNDLRFIDVGLLSKFPIGALTSFQTAEHPNDPGRRVFSRDLLEVEILSPQDGSRLFTLYNNHLKSQFVPFGEDPAEGTLRNNERRRRQAETISRIVAGRQRPDSRFVILGDMNDSPESPTVAPLQTVEGRPLTNALAAPTETRAAPAEQPGNEPPGPAWTHRFKPSGEQPRHELLDQIWLSESLGKLPFRAFIDRRIRLTGDGSDHDPAFVEIEF